MAKRIARRWLASSVSGVGLALDAIWVALAATVLFSPEIADGTKQEWASLDRRLAAVPVVMFLLFSILKAMWDEAKHWEKLAGADDGPILAGALVFISIDEGNAIAEVHTGDPRQPVQAGRWVKILVALTATNTVRGEEVKLRIGRHVVDSTWESDFIYHGVTTTADLWFDIPASVSRGEHQATLEVLAEGRWFTSREFVLKAP